MAAGEERIKHACMLFTRRGGGLDHLGLGRGRGRRLGRGRLPRLRFEPAATAAAPSCCVLPGVGSRSGAALKRRRATRGVWWVCGSFRLPVAPDLVLAYTPLIPLSVSAGHVAPALWLRRLSAAAPWPRFRLLASLVSHRMWLSVRLRAVPGWVRVPNLGMGAPVSGSGPPDGRTPGLPASLSTIFEVSGLILRISSTNRSSRLLDRILVVVTTRYSPVFGRGNDKDAIKGL